MLMFLKKMRKSKAGYTLTELIVVVTVLGILAAVATPFVGDYITDARKNADLANAKVIEDILKRSVAQTGSLSADPSAEVKKQLNPIPNIQQSGMMFVLDRDTCTVTIAGAADAAKNEVQIKN